MVVYVVWKIRHCDEFPCLAVQEFALRHWNWSSGVGAQDEGTEARLFVASISKQPVNTSELGFANFLCADIVAQHEHISV